MSEPTPDSLTVTAEQAGKTLAALVRTRQLERSWAEVRRFIESRHVQINGELCLDSARRLKEGDALTLLARPARLPSSRRDELVIRFLDDHVVVVEKPAGINTVRHPAERDWDDRRKALSPTLEDRLQLAIAARAHRPAKSLPRLRIVHRLDKDTSGLVVFARTAVAERELGRQFHAHTVIRKYLALVPGFLPAQTIRSLLVRDRGDGRRGSTTAEGTGKQAITHIEVVERLPKFTLLGCRLETGRTHQIRIHLAEAGHPVCGEKVYSRRPDGFVILDESSSPRLFLHAAELGFRHPVTRESLRWEMSLPDDLAAVLTSLPSKTV